MIDRKKLMSGGKLRVQSPLPETILTKQVSVEPENEPTPSPEPKEETVSLTNNAPSKTAARTRKKVVEKTEVIEPVETIPIVVTIQKTDPIILNLQAMMEGNIKSLIHSDIRPDKLLVFSEYAKERQDILYTLARFGPEGIDLICGMSEDEDFIRVGKLKLLSWINRLSKNEFFRKVIKRLGFIVKALHHINKVTSEE